MRPIVKRKAFYNKPWYGSYRSMMDRCYREKAKNYPIYGGRGIKVCDEWKSIEAFETWVESSNFQKGMSLERLDVNKGYSPDNCIWATSKEQANNRRNTLYIEFDGEIRTSSEWADKLNINHSTLKNRYYRGLPIEKVLAMEDLR